MSDDFAVKGEVIDALEKLEGEVEGFDLGMVDGVEVKGGEVTLEVIFEEGVERDARHAIEDAVCDAVEALTDVREVFLEPKTQGGPAPTPEGASFGGGAPAKQGGPAPPRRGLRLAGPGAGAQPQKPAQPSPAAAAAGGAPAQRAPGGAPKSIPGVGQVIAVASGKGGVGKSTVACNLALALQHQGHKVGLLDIDIYGPSLPTLLGVKERPAVKDRQIVPVVAQGLKLMSLGFLMDDDTPVIWRGPIVTGIIRQFLQDVDWRGLDYLIIDLPPGTGDAQLSLAQTVPVDGAVVVTTPSDLALIDAARGLQMFKTLNVDVLGIVENMSHYVWGGLEATKGVVEKLRESDDSAVLEQVKALEAILEEHGRTYIFGQGGGRKEAERLELPLLGEIPLDTRVRRGGDAGTPILVEDPDAPTSQAFIALADKVAELKPASGEEKGGKKKGVFSFIRS